jgi:putative phosphoribosyl transferase
VNLQRFGGMMNSPIEVPGRFADRRHAGVVLAEHLDLYAGRTDLVVLALPRGGVPVGYEVARHLHAPLDVLVVRKLGAPDHPEYAIGAIAAGGITVFDDAALAAHHVTARGLYAIVKRERAEVLRRESVYRVNRPAVAVRGQVVIVVDDGLATGSTMRAAVMTLRQQHPAGIVVAAPVGSRQACEAISEVADQVICPLMPEPMSAVGQWYADFSETSDDEVLQWLAQPTVGSTERSA